MTAPMSSVEICNLALDRLGQTGVIASIESPTTTEEIIMARWYDMTRRALLREYVWNFAKARAMLARTGTPEFDFADAYLLPVDCLRVLSINGNIEIEQERDFDIEGRNLLCNTDTSVIGDPLRLRYTKDVTEVGKWDSLFVNLMTLILAENVSYKFTLKKGVLEQINGLIKQNLPKATTIDGQERPPRRVQRSKYLAARKHGTYPGNNGYYTVVD